MTSKYSNWKGNGLWMLALLALAAGVWRIDMTQAGQSSAASAKALYQQALHEQDATGNLKAAIALYERVLAAKPDRALAAQALLRMAECYQKLGSAEWRAIDERVVRDYADQIEAVATARARLGASASQAAEMGDIRVRRIWLAPNVDLRGSVSPDGRYLSFVDWRSNTGVLGLRDLRTGKEREVTSPAWQSKPGAWEYAASSVFSPDGKQIAYAWLNKDRRYDLRLIGVNGVATPRVLLDSAEISEITPGSWSPDGRSIAVVIRRQDNISQIGLVSTAGGSLRVLKSIDWRGSGSAFFSPDGKLLAFDLPTSQQSQERDVFVLAADGSREIPAVVHPGNDVAMGWSRDGRYLLFASDRSGAPGLWGLEFREGRPHGGPSRIKADIGAARSMGVTREGALFLAQGGAGRDMYVASIDFDSGKIRTQPRLMAEQFIGNNRWPDWSRDGKYVVYNSLRVETGTERQVLVIRSLESGQSRELQLNLTRLYDTRWAPDGRSLISSGEDFKGRYGIYRLDAQSGDAEFICVGHSPQWAPDGARIFLVRYDAERREHILVERAMASGTERIILRTPMTVFTLRISPDGEVLAARTREGSDHAVILVPVRGGEPREIVRVQQPEALGPKDLAWTPDGVFLLVTRSDERERRALWSYPAAGGEPRRIALERVLLPEVHPDGKQLAFTVGSMDGEVWAIENLASILNSNK
jgi:Tol biopolymer transport system component